MHAEAKGYRETDLPPVFVSPGQSKTVDFGLHLATNPSPSTPQFFDEPQFSVAGVTDTTNLGGHGSDVIVRTRDNLAKATASLGGVSKGAESSEGLPSEKSLRDTVNHDSTNFDANHRLGELLLNGGQPREALVYFRQAARIKPDDYRNRYDEAVANLQAGNYEQALTLVQDLLRSQENAELHHLLADVDEKSGDPLEAVRHYQRAAEIEPKEQYLFDWGTELLLHHAPEPALQVFEKGNRLFPRSERMLLGMGAAAFAKGSYDEAVQHICDASDINPGDPAAYLFLGRMEHAEKKSSAVITEKLQRFATLHPDSADANYYYAVALWKSREGSKKSSEAEVESLLHKALSRNPNFAAAYLQLGIVHSDTGNYAAAASEYEQALKLDPQMEEGHYRLARAYRELGKSDLAKNELRLYEQCVRNSADRVEKERHEIRQFVYTLRESQ